MLSYLIRRLLLVVPTLLGIMTINFAIIQAAPGGPVEQVIAKVRRTQIEATGRISGTGGRELAPTAGAPGEKGGTYRGAQGLSPEFIEEIKKQFGFDRPAHERYVKMVYDFARFDFGRSYFRDRTVMSLIVEKMPVSISLGLWSTLLIYAISIPLGIRKAVRDGSRFDVWTSGVVVFANAIPSYLFAILLIVVFAGGRYFQWFPLRGLTSDDWDTLSFGQQILDYFWHMTLPVLAMVISGFAGLTLLTKNSFLDQIRQQYVLTARAKGLEEKRVLYGHVFRNAMLIVISGFPATLIGILFTGALLIEVIFSLDGLGRLGFEAAVNRDYPVMFATMYVFTLIGLVMKIVEDFTYTLIDPRIDFESRSA